MTWLDRVRVEQPGVAVSENVKGMTATATFVTATGETTQSVLDDILDVVREELPMYAVRWSIDCARVFGPATRERLYLTMWHKRIGGAQVLTQVMKTLFNLMRTTGLRAYTLEECFVQNADLAKKRIDEK